MAESLKGVTLEKRSGKEYTKVNAEEHLKGKVVALYFSAHWCPPCRAFTPVLKDFYEELDGEPLEIVFVSFDRSKADLMSYMDEAHGNWCIIPFDDENIQKLAEKYGVQGIPALTVIKADGSVAVGNGRGDVQSKGPNAFKEWKAACGL